MLVTAADYFVAAMPSNPRLRSEPTEHNCTGHQSNFSVGLADFAGYNAARFAAWLPARSNTLSSPCFNPPD